MQNMKNYSIIYLTEYSIYKHLTKPVAKPNTTQNCKIYTKPNKLIIEEDCFSNIFSLRPSFINEIKS